ncbi:MAG: sulfotransferase domain-containing protein [Solirubrobacterales bacterium]
MDRVIPYVGSPPTPEAAVWGNGGHLIKSHERFSRTGGQGRHRFIYLVRDGRDVAVSYFFFCRRHGTWAGSFDDFLDAFLDGRLDGYGAWQDHVEGWLGTGADRSDHILLRYEDLHADASGELERCAAFLGTTLDEGRRERALAAGSADRMRDAERRSDRKVADPSIPNVRATKSSGWRDHFGPEQLAEFRRRGGRAFELAGYGPD